MRLFLRSTIKCLVLHIEVQDIESKQLKKAVKYTSLLQQREALKKYNLLVGLKLYLSKLYGITYREFLNCILRHTPPRTLDLFCNITCSRNRKINSNLTEMLNYSSLCKRN